MNDSIRLAYHEMNALAVLLASLVMSVDEKFALFKAHNAGPEILAMEAEARKGADAMVNLGREDLRNRDFKLFLYRFSSTQRLWGFKAIAPILEDREYWILLAEVWMMSKVVYHNKAVWLRLFTAKRAGREYLMKPRERRVLAAQAKRLTVYRGCVGSAGRKGMSWTLSRERAVFFSRWRTCPEDYANGSALLVTAEVARSDVFALLLGRKEREIIAHPKTVFIKAVETVSEPLH